MNMFLSVNKSYLFDCVTTETAIIFADDLEDAKQVATTNGLPDAVISPLDQERGYKLLSISTEEAL
jgi:hypothetical protein